jgi:putative flippase GtrA
MSETARKPVPFLASFSRAQVSSALATLADFGLLFFLTEIVHVYYVTSVAVGALAGAILNFMINRRWSFEASQGSVHHQAFRYALVSAGSLILNTGGTYLVTESFKIPYGFSVVAVSLLVGFAFNYPLHRYFVFKLNG